MSTTNLVLRNNTNPNENPMKAEKSNELNKDKANKKRMATSPAKGDVVKRSAFGDITNALNNTKNIPTNGKENNSKLTQRITKVSTRKSMRLQNSDVNSKVTEQVQHEILITEKIAKVRLSERREEQGRIEETSGTPSSVRTDEESQEFIDALDTFAQETTPTGFYEHKAPAGRRDLDYIDIDAENIGNPNEAPVYGFVIFEYMRARQSQFVVKPYFAKQKQITADMRSVLVDWMVEVQENFELNHETLYLAVKLVDLYLQKKTVTREILQLIGATALLVAAKFDERHPPYVDDFLYICDDAYNRNEILTMERRILHVIGFDINIPISYRFLRRYAKCSKTNMQTLTLARFALELSLLCHELLGVSESQLGAAALWLAFKMNGSGDWTDTLVYYSSHTEKDILPLAVQLNEMIVKSKGSKLQTVWQKYSHQIFYEVAKTPTLTEEKIKLEKERIEKNDCSDDISVSSENDPTYCTL